MATPKKKAAPKTAAKKAVASKAPAKKATPAKKPAAQKAAAPVPAIKKGSKLACKVCGFAFTVDNIAGTVEEAILMCCDTEMHHKKAAPTKK